MNEQNYDYLKNQVKFMGFGEDLNNDLLKNIQAQPNEFSLQHQTKFDQDDVSSTLNFEKSKQTDMYFFQNYEMAVKSPDKEDALKQTYYVGNNNNITLKERHNMLQGRAIHKTFPKLQQTGEGENIRFKPTGETYQAWSDLNFKVTDKDGNFEQRKIFDFKLEKTLDKYPLKELEDQYDKRRLVASMEKGNMAKATILIDGEEKKVLIVANPRDNAINFYDEHKQRMEVRQLIAPSLAQKIGEKQAMSNEQQQGQSAGMNPQGTGSDNTPNQSNQQKEQQSAKLDQQNAGSKKRNGVKV